MRCEYLPQDYTARLHGGLARYDGKCVMLTADERGIWVHKHPNADGDERRVDPDDPLLDISSPLLGYCNTKNNAIYLFRRPDRRYKQTLVTSHLSAFNPENPNDTNTGLLIEPIFFSKAIVDCIDEVYPSFEDVLKTIWAEKTKIKTRAITRDICLSVDSFGITRVYHKMSEVGYIRPDQRETRTIIIPPSGKAWVVSKYLEGFNWEIK